MPGNPLETNAERYERLFQLAAATNPHRRSSVLAIAGAAASSAWHHHTGLFADARLEAMIGAASRVRKGVATNSKHSPERILHVLTAVQEVGGHTRLVTRWMETDDERRHSVAITWQGWVPVPDSLRRTVDAAGGSIHHLDRIPGGLGLRSDRLRQLARQFDRVVLHIHPDDPVPVAAFQKPRPCPVLFVNHADHVFWLGTTAADLFLCIRQPAADLCVSRRGIPRERTEVLPIPIDIPDSTITKEEARRQLGIPSDTVVLISVASEYKFRLNRSRDFVGIHSELIRADESLYHLVAGPSPDSPNWVEAAQRTQGRFRALGEVPDLNAYWRAADIYVEAFPFSALTAFLEAAAYGLPAVSHDPFSGASKLQIDDPDWSHSFLAVPDEGKYLAALRSLAADPTARSSLGGRAKSLVHERHARNPWTTRLDAAYLQADLLAKDDHTPDFVPIERNYPDERDRILAMLQSLGQDESAGLPIGLRFASVLAARDLFRDGLRPSRPAALAYALIPDWARFLGRPLIRTFGPTLRRLLVGSYRRDRRRSSS